MAIHHSPVKQIKRSQGHSAVAAAAYRSGEYIYDERLGLVQDYSRRHGVVYSEIIAPDHAPDWMKNRSKLWNGVEAKEIRKDAQLAREVEVALPRELDMETNKELLREFITENFVKQGMVADFSIHEDLASDGGKNPHAHIMLTMRDIKGDAFGNKNRDWNGYEGTMHKYDRPMGKLLVPKNNEIANSMRKSWADNVNRYLEMAGFNDRIDHRSLADQGIERQPTVHVGKDAWAMEEKGIPSERGNKNREITLVNTAHVLLGDTGIEEEVQQSEWYVPDPVAQQWARAGLAYQAEDHELSEVIGAEDDGVEQASQFEGWYIPDPNVQKWAAELIGQIAEDQERQEWDRTEEAEIELEPHIYDQVEAERGVELGR